jgi:hypothetical protein
MNSDKMLPPRKKRIFNNGNIWPAGQPCTMPNSLPQDEAPIDMYWQAPQTLGLAASKLELRTLAWLEFPLK